MSHKGKVSNMTSVSFLPECKHKGEGSRVTWCRNKKCYLFFGGPCSKRCLKAEPLPIQAKLFELLGGEAMMEYQAGMRIRFLRDLGCGPTGEHPAYTYARKGDGGRIVRKGTCWEGFMVLWDNWPSAAFGCEPKDFEIETSTGIEIGGEGVR